jgi:hypothetical protein
MLLQDVPSSGPVDQDEGDVWDTVGAVTDRSTNPAPTTEDSVPERAQEQTGAMEPQPLVEEVQGPPPVVAAAVGQPKERVEEPPVEVVSAGEPGIVDITRLLGAPTVTVVQSTL